MSENYEFSPNDIPPSEDEKLKAELDKETAKYVGNKRTRRIDRLVPLIAILGIFLFIGEIEGLTTLAEVFSYVPYIQNIITAVFLLPIALLMGFVPFIYKRIRRKTRKPTKLSRRIFMIWCITAILLALGAILGGIFLILPLTITCIVVFLFASFLIWIMLIQVE